jgi:hypothetical protein
MKKRSHSDRLPVEKIIRDFEREEAKPGRKGALKLAPTFDEALGRILKAKPTSRSK